MSADLDLSQFGLSLQDLRQILAQQVTCGSADLLLACGSLVEGLGNSRSDLDMSLISADAPRGIEPERNGVVIAGRLLCDILFLHPEDVEALAGALAAATSGKRDVRGSAKRFSYFELRLMHRLATAIPILPELGAVEAYRRLSGSFPVSAVARLKLDRSRYESSALQLDLAGLRDAGEWTSMVFAAQELLGWTLDALLATHHLTNPTPKWRSKLLDRLPYGLMEQLLRIPRVGPPSWAAILLNSAPSPPEPRSVSHHALRIAAFSRSVFLSAEQPLMDWRLEVPDLADASTPHAVPSETLPALDLDVCLRTLDTRLEVFRLNDMHARMLVDAESAALAVLFDGRTTIAQASHALAEKASCGSTGAKEHAQRVRALRSALLDAGLTAPPLSIEWELDAAIARQ